MNAPAGCQLDNCEYRMTIRTQPHNNRPVEVRLCYEVHDLRCQREYRVGTQWLGSIRQCSLDALLRKAWMGQKQIFYMLAPFDCHLPPPNQP